MFLHTSRLMTLTVMRTLSSKRRSRTPACSAELYNHACRLTGRAVFRRKLLSQAGILIGFSTKVLKQDASQLAGYLKCNIESAAGASLDAYRHS